MGFEDPSPFRLDQGGELGTSGFRLLYRKLGEDPQPAEAITSIIDEPLPTPQVSAPRRLWAAVVQRRRVTEGVREIPVLLPPPATLGEIPQEILPESASVEPPSFWQQISQWVLTQWQALRDWFRDDPT